MHVPQRQPKRPLTIWTPHKITSRQPVASRVAKSPMWNGTMLSGAKQIILKTSSDRYLPSLWTRVAVFIMHLLIHCRQSNVESASMSLECNLPICERCHPSKSSAAVRSIPQSDRRHSKAVKAADHTHSSKGYGQEHLQRSPAHLFTELCFSLGLGELFHSVQNR